MNILNVLIFATIRAGQISKILTSKSSEICQIPIFPSKLCAEEEIFADFVKFHW